MSIRFLQRNLVARHNQLLRVKSNGQPLERSQPPRSKDSRHREKSAAIAEKQSGGSESIVGEDGVAGGLLRGRVGALHATARIAGGGRRGVRVARGRCGWRRSHPANDAGASAAGNVHAREFTTANGLV